MSAVGRGQAVAVVRSEDDMAEYVEANLKASSLGRIVEVAETHLLAQLAERTIAEWRKEAAQQVGNRGKSRREAARSVQEKNHGARWIEALSEGT